MRAFFKPTKAKLLVTVLILLFESFFFLYSLSFYGTSLPDLCLPRIPDISGNQMPLPTPEPVTFSNVFTEIVHNETGNTPCLNNGPAAQVAYSITQTVNSIGSILLVILLAYVLSCIVIFFVNLPKKQKKSPAKSKK